MRSLHELYLILWESIKDKEIISGLCFEIRNLNIESKINFKEFFTLSSHFESQEPNKNLHSEFLENDTWKGCACWWNSNETFNPINRKAFIQKMIEITKENDNTPKN